jgi:phosphoglucosamine mutase
MSNLGLELALREAGLELARARVGDRFVKEMMEARGWSLGGESSGHIICSDVTTTGDGIVAALQVLHALQSTEGGLAGVRAGIQLCPQTMINVAMADRAALDQNPGIGAAVARVEEQLAGRGRVLLRPSGTEPVVRVMVEGQDAEEVQHLCSSLADEVERMLA